MRASSGRAFAAVALAAFERGPELRAQAVAAGLVPATGDVRTFDGPGGGATPGLKGQEPGAEAA